MGHDWAEAHPDVHAQDRDGRAVHRGRLSPPALPGTLLPRPHRALQATVTRQRDRQPVGLTNPAHFSRAFRTAYGVAPPEYRRLA